MAIVKVTKKGQITIPEEIRKAKGIEPGTYVTIDLKDGDILIKKVSESVVLNTSGIWADKISPDYYKELREESEKRTEKKWTK